MQPADSVQCSVQCSQNSVFNAVTACLRMKSHIWFRLFNPSSSHCSAQRKYRQIVFFASTFQWPAAILKSVKKFCQFQSIQQYYITYAG